MSRAPEKMIRRPSLLAPDPRLRRQTLPGPRRRVVDVKRAIRFPREPPLAVPSEVLQTELGADVVDQEVVVARVDVQGDVVVCGEGWEDGVGGRSGEVLDEGGLDGWSAGVVGWRCAAWWRDVERGLDVCAAELCV